MQTIGMRQLVGASCDVVEAQKGSQRHPCIDTVSSGTIMVPSIVPDLMADATNRDPCCLIRSRYIHPPPVSDLVRSPSEAKDEEHCYYGNEQGRCPIFERRGTAKSRMESLKRHYVFNSLWKTFLQWQRRDAMGMWCSVVGESLHSRRLLSWGWRSKSYAVCGCDDAGDAILPRLEKEGR